jgi:hypothetical protein
MSYIPTIVVDDDNIDVLRIFKMKSAKAEVKIEAFDSWDLTRQYLESGNPVDAIILDAKGKLTSDSNPGEAHVLESLIWVKARKIPYAFYTAYTDSLEILSQQIAEGRVFTKGKHKEEDVFAFLKKEIANSPKAKYPEPFECFGNDYLDMKYQDLLMNIVLILENDEIKNPEHLLFNPCRIILERVFEKITEIEETVLPYALLNFERQRAGLLNCYKHLSGIPYNLNREREHPANYLRETENEFISKQLDTIITVCHPGSHEIQKSYSSYTFKSVLWALFDVLIWLKNFVDVRK